MNKLIITFLFVVVSIITFPLASPSQADAQTCTGAVVCCQPDDWRRTCNPSGCTPGSPGCNCNFSCQGSTFNRECNTTFTPGQCTTFSCEYPISGTCSWSYNPTPTPTSGPGPTSNPGWGSCGSCSSCGGYPSSECVRAPDGACLHDPSSCGPAPALPFCRNVRVTPSTVVASPGQEVNVTVNWEGTAWPPGSAQNGAIAFRPSAPGIFQMRGGVFGPYTSPPGIFYTNNLTWPYKSYYAYNICCGDSWGAQSHTATFRANNPGTTSFQVAIVKRDDPNMGQANVDPFTNGTLNSANSCIGNAVVTVLSPSPSPQPTCSISLDPSGTTLVEGGTGSLTTTVLSQQNGTISEIRYSTNNSSIVTATSPDNAAPYQTTLTAAGQGTATILAEAVMNGSVRCSDTSTVIVHRTPSAWLNINDGDLISNGGVNVSLAPSTYLLSPLNSTEGVVVYNGALNLDAGQVSQPQWTALNGGIGGVVNYQDLRDRVPSTATVTAVSGAVSSSTFSGASSSGYSWYESSGNLNITNLTIPAGRKVVLFVNGNVTITGPIAVTNLNNSFFMVIASGDITVNTGVGSSDPTSTTPTITGIFFGNRFVTSSGNQRINVLGTVATTNGVILQRDTQSANPSESFTFSPELIFNYPPALGIKRAFWKEVAP